MEKKYNENSLILVDGGSETVSIYEFDSEKEMESAISFFGEIENLFNHSILLYPIQDVDFFKV